MGIAAKTKALAIATSRENAGMAGDILGMIEDAYFEQGMDLQDAINSVQDQLIQRAIDRYSDKIRAALARAGLDLPDGELTLEAIKGAVIDKTGLDLTDLTPDAMVAAVDRLASDRLSVAIGVQVASVMNGATLADNIRAGVAKAITAGRGMALLTNGLSQRARVEMTWNRAGITTEQQRRRVLSAWYQKKYRRTHVEVWVTQASPTYGGAE